LVASLSSKCKDHTRHFRQLITRWKKTIQHDIFTEMRAVEARLSQAMVEALAEAQFYLVLQLPSSRFGDLCHLPTDRQQRLRVAAFCVAAST
jgi:hypothetical protein